MDIVVFDLEWNQCPDGKRYAEESFPFEIIEIGAVKLNERMEIVDTFQTLIRPQVYRWIHNSIHDVVHVDYKELIQGMYFQKAVKKFMDWCGEEYIFCTWGCQDVMELQRNMKYYDLLTLLPGPVVYYDVQKLYGMFVEDNRIRRSLEYAIEQMNIPKDQEFHRALADAVYTARVLQGIDIQKANPYYSIDVYQNPHSKVEEIFITYPTYKKYVSREFDDRESAMKDKEVGSMHCPTCGKNCRRKIRWFTSNGKNYLSLAVCQEHGLVKGKIRVRKTEEGMTYVVKTNRFVTEEEAEELRVRRENASGRHHVRKKEE